MAPALEPQVVVAVGEHRSLLRQIDWQGYETLLARFGNHGTRVTCDQGTVESMSSSMAHEFSVEDQPTSEKRETAWEILERMAGTIDAPEDWSAEHDHYLYGTPKRGETKA